jgi:hypothetical protein
MRRGDIATVDAALYEDRTLIRALGMRRTVFVMPVELMPIVQAACTDDIAARERRRTVGFLSEAGVAPDVPAWLSALEDETVEALGKLGEATGAELSREVAGLRTAMLYSEGTGYESRQYVTTRVLTVLGAQGRIVRGRPRGTWASSQFRWAVAPVAPGPPVPTDRARAELVRRYLARFGPVTSTDVTWWTGLAARVVARALADVQAVEVTLDGGVGWVLPDDLEPEPHPDPDRGPSPEPDGESWACLLPALDATPMGWKQRDWVLGEHAPALFDRTGNIGPTIWLDGRIVGGWGQRPDASIAYRLLEDVSTAGRAAVESEVARTSDLLAGVRVTPRFGTPLQRELSQP